MEKTALMRAFKAMCAETGTAMSEKCKQVAAPLIGLKPMEIREAHIRSQQLAREVCYDGRVIHANICASAKVGKRLVLCLVEAEAEEGGGAAYLHIFNALTSTSKPDQAELLFPRDARLAIKEPLCFCSIMHVSSPASVDLVGLAKKSRRRPVEELRKEGNRLLLKRNYVLSELYFTECISLFMSRDRSTYGEAEKEVFSNRAEARMRLGRFEEAIADADFALEIKNSGKLLTVGSLCSKGLSLSALQDHQRALDCFQSAAALHGEEPAPDQVREGLTRCGSFLRQSRTGEYEISEYLLGGLDDKTAPEFSDYIGPLEVRVTPDGRGRGVYLTQDVKVGDLLTVCNPVAVASGYEEADEDLYVELVRACTDSEKKLKQVLSLAHEPEVRTLPDMKLFGCNSGKVFHKPGNRVVDIDRIRKVRDRVGFTWNNGDKYNPGLWGFTGLMNHSCLPNASKICIGKAAFVRAAKDLKAGEEVLLSYVEPPLAPLVGQRDRVVERFGFECGCRRCCLERDNKEMLKDLPYDQDIDIDEGVVDLVLEIEEKIKSFTGQEKNWIRASFPDFYCAACTSDDERLPRFEEVVKIFHDTAPGNTYTLSRMAILCDFCGSTPETKELLNEEVAGLYGRQSEQAVDAVIKKYRTPSVI